MQLSLEKLPILEQFLLSEEADWLANSKSKERSSRSHYHPTARGAGTKQCLETPRTSQEFGKNWRRHNGATQEERRGRSLRLDKFLTALPGSRRDRQGGWWRPP